ncbi:MAG: flavodoxin family protein [Methanomicrobiales archaeon]|nr:flavodoxin family protein [Methanomicrobiales archaeon]
MVKVLLLSGSPRAKGNTAQIMEECARVLQNHGVESEIMSLHGRSIEACTACGACSGTGECTIDDSLNEIIATLRTCQGFIIGAPVYFGTARGDVMNALQRIGMASRSSDRFLSRMVGGPIAVARRGGHTATLQGMLMFYLMNDMIVCGSTYWNMVFGRDPGEIWGDVEGMETIRRFAENVAFLVNRLHSTEEKRDIKY